ncbi:transferase [Cellulomonas sp.]|uniref:transferase n=1 Tax=Cellulomonas sp. TaxID=40001 RepID=UPI003BACE449
MTRRTAGRVEFEDEQGQMVRYVRHENGRGPVAPTARVHERAWLAETAYVEAGAIIGDGSRVGAGSWIDAGAVIGADVLVDRNVHVGPGTHVGDGARIGAGARLGRDVLVEPRARVEADQVVDDGGRVRRRGSGYGMAA